MLTEGSVAKSTIVICSHEQAKASTINQLKALL